MWHIQVVSYAWESVTLPGMNKADIAVVAHL